MVALYPSPLLSAASSHLHSSTKMAFRPHPFCLVRCNEVHALGESFKAYGLRPNSWHTISCAINMTT
ncbi:hypothetical protein DVH24_042221 [Malus domestica]|uniref:Uncharacterized protein n=1 Tax=Malus domestica TaxID=3750 RepID=A0A498IY63_MALDO|nr:hypothetical protein DVH24_042221 [Malus domestica]